MSCTYIVIYLLPDDFRVLFKSRNEFVFQFGCDFVADVQKLAHLMTPS